MSYFTLCSSVSIINFEHVIAGWENTSFNPLTMSIKRSGILKQTCDFQL